MARNLLVKVNFSEQFVAQILSYFSGLPVLQMSKGSNRRVPGVRATKRWALDLVAEVKEGCSSSPFTWSSGWTKKAIDCRADRRRNSCSGTTTRCRVAGNLWWYQWWFLQSQWWSDQLPLRFCQTGLRHCWGLRRRLSWSIGNDYDDAIMMLTGQK